MLDNDRPVDHPDLEPIWTAAEEHDLAIVHHSFAWTPPYFPGYRDMWDNVYIARLCSHPWGAMRLMAGFLAGGILDRHPGLRLAVLECGFGWLPYGLTKVVPGPENWYSCVHGSELTGAWNDAPCPFDIVS